jgi:hypothetical protein
MQQELQDTADQPGFTIPSIEAINSTAVEGITSGFAANLESQIALALELGLFPEQIGDAMSTNHDIELKDPNGNKRKKKRKKTKRELLGIKKAKSKKGK